MYICTTPDTDQTVVKVHRGANDYLRQSKGIYSPKKVSHLPPE